MKLCADYREAVLLNGWERYSRSPYGYGTFNNGEVIQDATRREYRLNADLQKKYPFPFEASELALETEKLQLKKGLLSGCHEARLRISEGRRRSALGFLLKTALDHPMGVFTRTFMGTVKLLLKT